MKIHGNTVHGCARRKQNHPIYTSWRGMIERCQNPNHVAWSSYGGRGIRVCLEWLKFENFLRDMGPTWKEGLTVERIDNDGPYNRYNCRWATTREQNRNSRRNHKITFNGKTLSITEWAETVGLTYSILRQRLKKGRPMKEALSRPVGRWIS